MQVFATKLVKVRLSFFGIGCKEWHVWRIITVLIDTPAFDCKIFNKVQVLRILMLCFALQNMVPFDKKSVEGRSQKLLWDIRRNSNDTLKYVKCA